MDSYNRLTAANKIEAAWTGLLGAQGGSKDMKKWTSRWENAAKPLEARGEQNDLKKFVSKFGGGI